MMGCIDDNTLASFVQGRLPPEQVAEVERHVDHCADCTLLLVYFGRSFGQTDEAPENAPYRAMPKDDGQLPSVGSHLGRFAIVHRVASGGMGVVFTAFDPTLNRRVAIKLLHPDASDENLQPQRDRVLREARAMARLAHPNVLSIYDVGTFGDQIFLAMELVEGVTLRTWLALEHRPAQTILEALHQAGKGLAAAHAAGIVHGDFKPDNILVGTDGRARVMDFGLARSADDAPASRRAIETGLEPAVSLPGGTLAYMAPEQIADALCPPSGNAPRHKVLSDQYAFCVVLYESLFYQRPFSGNTPEALLRSQHDMRPGFGRRKDVPAWLPAVLSRGLDPDPAHRFPSMEQLLAALGGEESRRAFAHVRATAILLIGMWVIHLAWAAFTIPIMIHRAADPSPAPPSSLDVGAAVAALLLLGWVPLGVIGTPINATGLFLRKGWARIGTLLYALVSLPTCIGTPFAAYALWTLTRPAVRKHVFEAPITQEDPARSLSHDGHVHWRTNTFVQLGMWVVHAALMVFVIPLLIHMLVPGESAPPEPKPYGSAETFFLSFMALFTLIWAPLGTVWTAINALGLWRQRSWGRLSTLVYALLSLPTGLGTPAAVYALWSLSRPGVKSSIQR